MIKITLSNIWRFKFSLFATKVLDDPFLSGTLRWLFIGCGAIEVIEEGDF